jgi:hypothetical protein
VWPLGLDGVAALVRRRFCLGRAREHSTKAAAPASDSHWIRSPAPLRKSCRTACWPFLVHARAPWPAPRQTPIIANFFGVSTRAGSRINGQPPTGGSGALACMPDGSRDDSNADWSSAERAGDRASGGGALPAAPGPRVGAGVAVRHKRISSSTGSCSHPSGIGKRRLRVEPDWKHSQPCASACGADPCVAVMRTGEAGRTSHTSHVIPIRSTNVLCAISVRLRFLDARPCGTVLN